MSDSLPQDSGSDGFDPDERALCADPSCIGVLDNTGRCKLCGQQGAAVTPAAQISPELPGLPGAAAELPSADPELTAAALLPGPAADADSDDFADRRLCEDQGCIGVLDSAGRCKECGRVAGSASY